jgi:UDP-glucose 4-epimerase
MVTGACGLIGSHVAESLARDGVPVRGFDDLSVGSLENVAGLPGFELVRGDVLNESDVSRAMEGCDVVVHLAARKIPRYGDRLITLRVNSVGAQVVLAEAARRGARTFIASTSDVYWMNPDMPINEESSCVIGPPTVPRWSYALSKLYNEQLALAHAQESGLRVTVMRFFGTYGPGTTCRGAPARSRCSSRRRLRGSP